MATFSEVIKPAVDQATSWGLAGFGKSGKWELSIDEATVGPDQWRLQIEGPTASLNLPIPSPDVIGDAIHVLSHTASQSSQTPVGFPPASVVVETGKENAISLFQDDEHVDRFFLVIQSSSGLSIRLAILEPDLACLIDALLQVQAELSETPSRLEMPPRRD